MSHRSRAAKARQHVHCDSCFSRRCRARGEGCAVAPCRLLCGALYHLCKEEDHLLLCPNVRVPCLNAGYGCPVQLPRSSQAAHLQVCPASVVCCSMEWIRWPTDDTNPHGSAALQENVLKETERGGALDLAMALVDQSDLYSRLKMRPLFPELMEEEEEEEETATGGSVTDDVTDINPSEAGTASAESDAGEAPHSGVGPKLVIDQEKFNLLEMMFSMERGGCRAAQENLDKPGEKAKPQRGGEPKHHQVADPRGAKEDGGSGGGPDTSKTGLAPWQEGVLERLGQELTPQEYNMYVVHHGRMLIAFGQIEACTPREKDFVYGSLEPIPVQTLRSFKVPDSYHYRRRVHLYDTAARAQSEPRGVDTSDLGAREEDWFGDEASATLLGYAEEAVMGHKISESKAADGLYIDVGTQTHSFRSAPFKRRATLAEVMADGPPKLRLQLQTESVNSRHNRASCAFTFLCGHAFLRREFATHFRNVHGDIQTSLSGWFEQRCPLSYLGCTFSHRRFQPSTHEAQVTYSQELRCFNLRPSVAAGPGDAADPSARRGRDPLSSLPYEVLCHVAGFLDGLSLSQLALVSRLMRQVSSSLLRDRGMVTLRWERRSDSRGGAKWRAKPVWEFSRLFSSVDSWHMADVAAMSAHLKACPYYETSVRSEPVALPSVGKKQPRGQETTSLVNHFTANRRKQ